MWYYGKNRVAQVIVAGLCIFALNVSTVANSLSPTTVLQQAAVNEESVLVTKAVDDDGVQQLVEHNFLVGIASLGAFYENRTQCGQELELMLNAMAKPEVWGLKGVCFSVCVFSGSE